MYQGAEQGRGGRGESPVLMATVCLVWTPPPIQAETCGVSQARHYIRAALPLPLWLGLKGVSHVHFFIFKAGQRLDLV